MELYRKMILYTNYALYGLFALAVLGIERTSTYRMAMQVENIYKFMIGAILVAFANPYAEIPIDFLKKLAFSAGLFLVASSSVTGLILHRTSATPGTSPPSQAPLSPLGTQAGFSSLDRTDESP